MSAREVEGEHREPPTERRGRRVGGEFHEPSAGRRGRRIAGGRLVALAAVLVMASVGQCQLPQPNFPKLGVGPGHGGADPASAVVAFGRR